MIADQELSTARKDATIAKFVRQALDITSQDWSRLGCHHRQETSSSESFEEIVDRVTSLILIRLVAVAVSVSSLSQNFSDLSTTTICNTLIEKSSNGKTISHFWPQSITDTTIQELRTFVQTILQGYNQVGYHNFEHAYHVLSSCNKLLDVILQSRASSQSCPYEQKQSVRSSTDDQIKFDDDPLMHLALLFAALIHDVEHQGVPNKQLVIENHPLAIQYNDQSVAEQRSLTIAFTELLKENYDNLREVMMPVALFDAEEESKDGYRRFREAVTSLVLATDIATPERSDIVKQKWKKAFIVCHEKEQHQRRSSGNECKQQSDRRQQRRNDSSKSTSSSLLRPPREHPTPIRGKHKTASISKPKSPTIDPPELELLQDSWVELGATSSTNFPTRKMDHSSFNMHDSMEFWWFCPSELGDDEVGSDEESSDTFEEPSDTFASMSCTSFDLQKQPGQEEQQQHLQKTHDLDNESSLHMSQGSTWLEDEKDVPLKRPTGVCGSDSSLLSDDFYQSATASFHHSLNGNVATPKPGSEDLQHLLTPCSKVNRLRRTVINHQSPTSSISASSLSDFDLFSPHRQDGVHNDTDPRYSDLTTRFSSSDGNDYNLVKAKGGLLRRTLGNYCTPKKHRSRQKTRNLIVIKDEEEDTRKSFALNLHDASEATIATATSVTTLTTSSVSSDNKMNFHDDAFRSSSLNDESGTSFFTAIAQQAEVEEETAPLKGEEEDDREGKEGEGDNDVRGVDEHLYTISLLEHILLVSDVSHNMQSWDVMIEFSHRLSKEIQNSIREGRSGGITDDPLSDWYTNQSGFIHGYIKPLAERLEQTGCLPSSLNNRDDEDKETLVGNIDLNLERWQEEGHDIIIEWRRLREKEIMKANKKKEKQKLLSKSRTKKMSDRKKKNKSRWTSKKSSSRKKSTSCDAPGSKLDFSYEKNTTSDKDGLRRDVLKEQVLAPFGRLAIMPTESIGTGKY